MEQKKHQNFKKWGRTLGPAYLHMCKKISPSSRKRNLNSSPNFCGLSRTKIASSVHAGREFTAEIPNAAPHAKKRPERREKRFFLPPSLAPIRFEIMSNPGIAGRKGVKRSRHLSENIESTSRAQNSLLPASDISRMGPTSALDFLWYFLPYQMYRNE